MPPIAGSVQIRRTPEEVFNYVADATRRPEWQEAVEKIVVEHSAPGGVGTRVRETRRIQGRSTALTWEVTQYAPGRLFGLRGVDGPDRPLLTMTLTPLDDGSRTLVGIELDFETHGIGRLLGLLARRGARKDVDDDGQHLKEQLERPGMQPAS